VKVEPTVSAIAFELPKTPMTMSSAFKVADVVVTVGVVALPPVQRLPTLLRVEALSNGFQVPVGSFVPENAMISPLAPVGVVLKVTVVV